MLSYRSNFKLRNSTQLQLYQLPRWLCSRWQQVHIHYWQLRCGRWYELCQMQYWIWCHYWWTMCSNSRSTQLHLANRLCLSSLHRWLDAFKQPMHLCYWQLRLGHWYGMFKVQHWLLNYFRWKMLIHLKSRQLPIATRFRLFIMCLRICSDRKLLYLCHWKLRSSQWNDMHPMQHRLCCHKRWKVPIDTQSRQLCVSSWLHMPILPHWINSFQQSMHSCHLKLSRIHWSNMQ